MLTRVKFLDFVSRVIPSAFFLYVVLLKLQDLITFLKIHASAQDPNTLRFVADLVTRVSVVCFLGLMSILFLIRLQPINKAKGLLPRVMAIAGTFFVSLVTFFPRANLSTALMVTVGLLCLLGTCLSIFVLAYLGRSFSFMAEARRLVTTGPYKFVRHPLYLSEELAAFAIFLQFISFKTLIIFLAHALIQFQRMRNEEQVLEQTFPDYGVYKLRTARLIPRVY